MMESKVPNATPEELDARLNEALDETFPASDPIAVHREAHGLIADELIEVQEGK